MQFGLINCRTGKTKKLAVPAIEVLFDHFFELFKDGRVFQC